MGIDMSNDVVEAKEMMDGGSIADTEVQPAEKARKKKKNKKGAVISGGSTPTDFNPFESLDNDATPLAQSKFLDVSSLQEQIRRLEIERNHLLETNARLETELSTSASAEDLSAAQAHILTSEETILRQELTIAAQGLRIEENKSLLESSQRAERALQARVTELEELAALRADPEQLQQALEKSASTIVGLERKVQELQSSASQSLSALQGQYETVFEHNNQLSNLLSSARRELAAFNERKLPEALLNRAALNMSQVDSVIVDLELLIEDAEDADPQSDISKALNKIANCLKEGLASSSPQAYFDGKKDDLKTDLNALRGLKSHFNTALNAILAVLAVCSVVGIPALWLTGTLQKNMEKNGSIFAFTMFGAKQRVECDIYQATQAMGVKLGA
jgi:hypothetical protein